MTNVNRTEKLMTYIAVLTLCDYCSVNSREYVVI